MLAMKYDICLIMVGFDGFEWGTNETKQLLDNHSSIFVDEGGAMFVLLKMTDAAR